MRIALFATCLADALFPRVGAGHGRAAGAAGPRGGVPRRRRRAAGRCTSTPATGARRCRWCATTSRCSSGADGGRRVVAPSGSCVGSVRHQHAMVARRAGDEALAERAEAVAGADLRAVRAAGRRARGRGRRRVLPAPGHLPPDLPLAADAAGRRQAAAAAAARCAGIDLVELPGADQCCGFGGTFAVKNADTSTAMLADKMRRRARAPAPRSCTAGDSSCLMHIGGGLSRLRAGHPDGAPGRDPRRRGPWEAAL